MVKVQQLIDAVEQAYSPSTLIKAVRELSAVQDETAIPTLIQVFGFNNPGAAVAAVQGLVALGDVAVPPLLSQIDGYDYGARAWSHRALSQIGDPRALDTLTEAATADFALSVRRAAAKGLGSLRWEKLPPQNVPAAQQKVLVTLQQASTQDPEWVVRYAAIVGLQSLAVSMQDTLPESYQAVLTHLQEITTSDAEVVVRSRSQLALDQLNFNPALL
jgi:phycocyanobilin lyase beta subunit